MDATSKAAWNRRRMAPAGRLTGLEAAFGSGARLPAPRTRGANVSKLFQQHSVVKKEMEKE